MNARLERVYLETETLGSWYWNDEMVCKTMELPDKGNAHNISCIPEGIYAVKKEAYTEKHPYPHFRIYNVPDRNGILVHKITYVKDLRGCIGVGNKFVDLNGDKVPDMVESSLALNKLYALMPEDFMLEIKKKQTTL